MNSIELEERLAKLEQRQALADDFATAAFWTALDASYAITLPDRLIRCIVCDREACRGSWEILSDECMFGGGRLERYRCPDCDCVFGPMKFLDLSEAFVRLDYRMLYSRYSEGDSTESERRTFQALDPAPGKAYLDWGCGGAWSRTIDTLRADGFDVWGFEPSALEPSDFIVIDRNQIGARFDGIFSNNVIEHFRDPIAQFRDLHGLLKDGALMAHSSPCYDYAFSFTRFHSLFLLGRSPEVLANRTGFRVVDRERDGEYINLIYQRR
ncbi:MAG TPA: class I SAM-dependent methyltransferase [Sphingomicrobium sp.]|nr:class I SAM-dependent methyltransferase [Sphingomicrobium sp.]